MTGKVQVLDTFMSAFHSPKPSRDLWFCSGFKRLKETVDLSKNLYDMTTYNGRASHFYRSVNPLNLLKDHVSARDVVRKGIVLSFYSRSFSHFKWDASSRWSFGPNPAFGSIETTTIGNMLPTLLFSISNYNLW